MSKICFNGKIIDASQPVFKAANRGYRYGDGFFETIRIANGNIPLASLHKQRIEQSISLLKYVQPVTDISAILNLCIELSKINCCEKNSRVRLSFFNGTGNVFDDNKPLEYVIEAAPLAENFNTLNASGLSIGICSSIIKSCDSYANIKSANYLFSRVAVEFAKKNAWHDALILNQHNRICESAIANVFWVKANIIYTPPLTEGCVDGVMRKYLMSQISITEKNCHSTDLQQADEMFLTNAVSGIRWVAAFEGKEFSNKTTKTLYADYISPFWPS